MITSLPIYIGTIIDLNDRFISHKLPGFHTCGKKSFPFQYFYQQRLIQLQFNETYEKKQIIYNHCHMVLTDEDVSLIKNEMKEDNSITFHFHDQFQYVHIFDPKNNQIFTHFDIIIDNITSQFNIIPGKPVNIEPAKFLDITFSLSFGTVNDIIKRTSIFPPIFSLSFLIIVIITAVISHYYSNYFQNDDLISQTEVWKRPRSYSNTVVVGAAGIQIICAVYVVCRNIKHSLFTEQLLYNALLIGTVALSIFRGAIGSLFGDDVQDPELLAPTLFIYSIFMIPLKIINALSNILGSCRGPNLIPSIIKDIIFLLFTSFLARGFSFCFHSMIHQNKPVPYSKAAIVKKMGFSWKLASLVVDVICALLLFPCAEEIIISDLIHQFRPNYLLIITTVQIYFAVLFLFSIIKTVSKLKNGTDNWMTSHFSDAFMISIILLILITIDLIFRKLIHSHQAFLFVACYSVGLLMSVFCIGVCASLSAAVVFVYFTFKRNRTH